MINGALKRSLITVYSLVILLSCFLEGCLSQPGEVISQVEKKSDDALLASKTSSSFNYFEAKKKYSSTQSALIRNVDESSPKIKQVEYQEVEKPGRVKISGPVRSELKRPSAGKAAGKVQKPVRPKTEKRLESWRSKSLIESAKRIPSKVVNTYHQMSDHAKPTSNSVSEKNSSRIRKVVNSVQSTVERDKTEKTNQHSESSAGNQIRTDELRRYNDQTISEEAHSEITQLEQDLKRDLEQSKPTSENVNSEMRRLQIHTVMDRARQAAKQKKYEYALFLAEQAMKSSYHGHVTFSPDEQSPQELIQHIKSISPVQKDSEVKPLKHTKSEVKSNGGQVVENIQFSPSAVHPLKRRATVKPKAVDSGAEKSAPTKQEMPLITPRNRSIQRRKSIVLPDHPPAVELKKRAPEILLEPPTFEQKPEEPVKLTEPDTIQQKKSNSDTQPKLQQKLEGIPEKAPETISDPETVKQETKKEVNNATSPGPKLMLPKVPSAPQDLTSQTGKTQAHQATVLNHSGQNQKTQTAPVNFKSQIQNGVQNEATPPAVQNSEENRDASESSLVLDEIEWDLEEKQQSQQQSSWSSMSTVLLMISGLIILLLLTIIVVLLRRSHSPS